MSVSSAATRSTYGLGGDLVVWCTLVLRRIVVGMEYMVRSRVGVGFGGCLARTGSERRWGLGERWCRAVGGFGVWLQDRKMDPRVAAVAVAVAGCIVFVRRKSSRAGGSGMPLDLRVGVVGRRVGSVVVRACCCMKPLCWMRSAERGRGERIYTSFWGWGGARDRS